MHSETITSLKINASNEPIGYKFMIVIYRS